MQLDINQILMGEPVWVLHKGTLFKEMEVKME